jgi:catechol 2,3-dioxygenase-like lactoylglutathione lyase family enzyme
MGVGTMRCVVINVTDLELAYKFWGGVTGLEEIGLSPWMSGKSSTGWHDWLGYLGTTDPWKHEIILQRVDNSPLDIQPPDPGKPNQMHIDITPNNGIDQAVEEIIELGGTLKKAPSLYPRPGSRGDDFPLIDWAVMQDPFGNEFCLVEPLTSRQSRAAMAASDATTDQQWRKAADLTH